MGSVASCSRKITASDLSCFSMERETSSLPCYQILTETRCFLWGVKWVCHLSSPLGLCCICIHWAIKQDTIVKVRNMAAGLEDTGKLQNGKPQVSTFLLFLNFESFPSVHGSVITRRSMSEEPDVQVCSRQYLLYLLSSVITNDTPFSCEIYPSSEAPVTCLLCLWEVYGMVCVFMDFFMMFWCQLEADIVRELYSFQQYVSGCLFCV